MLRSDIYIKVPSRPRHLLILILAPFFPKLLPCIHRMLRYVKGWHTLNVQDCGGTSQTRHQSQSLPELQAWKTFASSRQKTVMIVRSSSMGPSQHWISTYIIYLLSGKKECSLLPHSPQHCWLLKQAVLQTQADFSAVVLMQPSVQESTTTMGKRIKLKHW